MHVLNAVQMRHPDEGNSLVVANIVPFTNNYRDQSTGDGHQFEFQCMRCGFGYTSSFQRSAAGFGGRLLRMGGDLLGGAVGRQASTLGWEAESMGDANRGSAHDKALGKAVEEIEPYFGRCDRCAEWVCRNHCWSIERSMCNNCTRELGRCAGCGRDSGGGKFCQHCGTPLVAAVGRHCSNCGAQPSPGAAFCAECGTPTT